MLSNQKFMIRSSFLSVQNVAFEEYVLPKGILELLLLVFWQMGQSLRLFNLKLCNLSWFIVQVFSLYWWNPGQLDIYHRANITYPLLRKQCGESFHLQFHERYVRKKYNLFIITYIFVGAELQSLFPFLKPFRQHNWCQLAMKECLLAKFIGTM